ncbi:MAG TPA: GAF domain-containing protein, partial [Roseiflexaceae bacterium]
MPADPLNAIRDPSRLAALRRLDLLDSPAEVAFDRLTNLAATILCTPIALVMLVDEERQFFKSCVGLAEPRRSKRETPLLHSFCQYVVASGKPLVVADARIHPLVSGSPAIRDLVEIAYAGAPLVTPDGYVIGSLCVVDTDPRAWREDELAILRDLAASVMTEIVLRGDTAERKRVEEALNANARQQAVIADLGQRALIGADLAALFNDAATLVAETLDVEFCEALELLPDGTALRLRAGAGWREGVVGRAIVGAGIDSQAGYTIFSDQPVIVDNLRPETRFRGSSLMRDHGVVNGITVIIRGQDQPFGVLGAHTTRQRMFTND